jgi:DNA anti-recombination protein RmuC
MGGTDILENPNATQGLLPRFEPGPCAESLAAENGSRLAAMQRAEKNIDDMVEDLNQTFHRLRQSSIDEELFDVVSGYESISTKTLTY